MVYLEGMAEQIDPSHEQKRSLLRAAGVVVLLIGLIFLIVGLVDFFSSMSSMAPPKRFWCAFVGLPLVAFGGMLSSAGFVGAVTRYFAGEEAPVAKDTANYLAEGTKEGVKTIATAVGAGLTAGMSERKESLVSCPKCNQANDAPAQFCKHCGAALAKTKTCPTCGERNDPDAGFCEHCGKELNKPR